MLIFIKQIILRLEKVLGGTLYEKINMSNYDAFPYGLPNIIQRKKQLQVLYQLANIEKEEFQDFFEKLYAFRNLMELEIVDSDLQQIIENEINKVSTKLRKYSLEIKKLYKLEEVKWSLEVHNGIIKINEE